MTTMKPDVKPGEVVGVIHDGPDKDEKYLFTLYWWADYHPGHPDGEHRLAIRGQVYRSRIDTRPAVRWAPREEPANWWRRF